MPAAYVLGIAVTVIGIGSQALVRVGIEEISNRPKVRRGGKRTLNKLRNRWQFAKAVLGRRTFWTPPVAVLGLASASVSVAPRSWHLVISMLVPFALPLAAIFFACPMLYIFYAPAKGKNNSLELLIGILLAVGMLLCLVSFG
jgi:hypothetical protein